MRKEYDFSKAKKAKPVKETKVLKTIRLDSDVLEWLEQEAEKQGMGYQTFLNWFLRKSMEPQNSIEERLSKLEKAVFSKKA
ncbi:BrnA antitoxin family protein [Bdellovibrio sp. 22V]|uniref:BrnA antitoxin family protein n=1 Tax=Bdellovibrio TaxID=958 RepID=UPI0025426D64|nr:BrnA antitoxin family protein [Bdellovibrio sp. 22V]WII71650.1 BrnA antitoxin family protein [Bdellovibrio sp. 22V]